MRITRTEIMSAIELFVNAIYDSNGDSGWEEASLQEWEDAVYHELTTWKTVEGWSYHSNENRFDGKDEILKRVRPMLLQRLKTLAKEGYEIKTLI